MSRISEVDIYRDVNLEDVNLEEVNPGDDISRRDAETAEIVFSFFSFVLLALYSSRSDPLPLKLQS